MFVYFCQLANQKAKYQEETFIYSNKKVRFYVYLAY